MKRREFLQLGAGAGLALSAGLYPLIGRTANPQVIVVGGGMAGASAAKYIRLWSKGLIDVTLVERDASYTSNIMSNEVLTGKRANVSTLNYSYNTLVSKYGINRVQGNVTEIDAVNQTVRVLNSAGAQSLRYDRLVLAPGVEFDLMPGMQSLDQYDTVVPHAWKAGPQTTLLRQQLMNMADGQSVVISIPLAPYRCPPGPYERACVIADWLKTNKPNSRLTLLDSNATIQAQAANFQAAFTGAYGYTVDYRPGVTIDQIQVVPGAHRVRYLKDGASTTLTANVFNPIAPQRAPALLRNAGLLNGNFAPVDLLSYESKLKPKIHVIGDASASGMPKAGHIGNQEGKTCANAVVNLLLGNAYAMADASPVLNSACFTPLTSTKASWLSAVYQYSNGVMVPANNNGVTQPRASSGASAENYKDMNKWFSTLMGDTFA